MGCGKTYADRRTVHDIGGGDLETKTHIRETTSDHDNPHNLDGSEREHRDIILVLEHKTDQKSAGKTDVLSKHVKNELLDVIEHATTFLDSVENGGEVVISKDNIRGFLGDIRTSLTHGNTDISTLERGRVVDTVTCHGDEALATMKSLNHADLGLRSATSDNEWKQGKVVNFVVSELIELAGSHAHRLGDIGGDLRHAARQDTNFESDSAGGSRVVTSKHVDGNTGLVAHADGGSSLRAGRVVETNETTEDKVLLELTALEISLVLLDLADIGARGKSENTETKGGHGLHVGKNVSLDSVGELIEGVAVLVLRARCEDTLDGTLGEEPLLIGVLVDENDGHLLDIGVEGELSNLVPLGLLASREAETVVVEARGVDLNGNLSGVTTATPLTLDLLNGGQVGKRGDVEVLLESLVISDSLHWSDSVAGRAAAGEVDVLGHGLIEADIADGRVEGLVANIDGVCTATGDPSLLDDHVALGQSTGLVGANV